METVDNRNFKEKVKDGVNKVKGCAKNIWNDSKEFVSENKGMIAFYAFILGPGLLKLGDSALKNARQKREQRYDECDFYDPRTGEHWYTRSPLTNRQKLELERRYNAGESKGSILKSMRKF